MRPHLAKASAFTLIELLIAAAILSSLVLLLTAMLSGINRIWVASEQRVSEFQDGRAILELMSRELSQAAISPSLQYVQNPLMAAGLKQRANSDSIFWQVPASSTTSGNLAELGYYLAEDHSQTGAQIYQLKRFFVPPTDGSNYQIFSPPNQPTDNSAPWVTNFITNSTTTTVAAGIIALWVRCYDGNGDLIPWLSVNATGVGPLKFNSAAHFQPAIPGQTSSFKYTNASNTARANLLPAAVELTIVTLDPQTFKRNPSIPAQNAQSAPDDLPTVRDSFNQQLITNSIRTGHTFSTRVKLVNSAQP
jgi:prepilin-type N-terminal cleavage/methylation domain-containing protein